MIQAAPAPFLPLGLLAARLLAEVLRRRFEAGEAAR